MGCGGRAAGHWSKNGARGRKVGVKICPKGARLRWAILVCEAAQTHIPCARASQRKGWRCKPRHAKARPPTSTRKIIAFVEQTASARERCNVIQKRLRTHPPRCVALLAPFATAPLVFFWTWERRAKRASGLVRAVWTSRRAAVLQRTCPHYWVQVGHQALRELQQRTYPALCRPRSTPASLRSRLYTHREHGAWLLWGSFGKHV